MHSTALVLAGHWWLTSVILATWEAEIGRIIIQVRPCQKVCDIPSQRKKAVCEACTCHPGTSEKLKIGGSWPRPA
jgi:hypothetical protein